MEYEIAHVHSEEERESLAHISTVTGRQCQCLCLLQYYFGPLIYSRKMRKRTAPEGETTNKRRERETERTRDRERERNELFQVTMRKRLS